MDEAPRAADGEDPQPSVPATRRTDDLEAASPTTLVEVAHGIAVLFGEVPDGLELIDQDLIPSFDRDVLPAALGTLGNLGTVIGNTAQTVAATTVQGLYRLDGPTMALLKNGAELAVKDGANLGAIFQNGKIIGQARLVPVSMVRPDMLAAVGPAVAMIALQMQLGEISGLVRTNIDLTTQTLKTIRNAQWSELEGLADSVATAVREARELETVTDTVWEPVNSSGPLIHKQINTYRKNVEGHLTELGRRDARGRRRYLEAHAEAMVFDTHALLGSLKVYTEYQVLRAARARNRGTGDEDEARLFDYIVDTVPAEVEELLGEVTQLACGLVRELRIIAELPGRAALPLSRRRRDAKAVRLTCAELLRMLAPLAERLCPEPAELDAPDAVCAPEELDLDPYLTVLRWFLADGEQLHAVAFPYIAGARDITGVVPPILGRRVDASWDALVAGRARAVVERLAPSTFVAITDRRIVTADPRRLLGEGEFDEPHRLEDVRFVRRRADQVDPIRPTIGVTTVGSDVRWLFPGDVDTGVIDALADLIDRGAAERIEVGRTAAELEAPAQ